MADHFYEVHCYIGISIFVSFYNLAIIPISKFAIESSSYK